jgi:hypothetical protein
MYKLERKYRNGGMLELNHWSQNTTVKYIFLLKDNVEKYICI